MKLLRVLAAVSLFMLLAGTALALDINKDFWNLTGQMANDCEIIIDGIQTLSCNYNGDAGMEFPNFVVSYEDIGGSPKTVLRWSGLVVAPGAKVHLGFCTPGGVILGMRWTWNGVPIGPVTQVDVQPTPAGVGLVASNVLNLSLWPIEWPIIPPPVYIGPVTVYYFSSLLPIGSLNNTMLPLWTPLAVVPIRTGMLPELSLPAGGSTTFTAPAPPSGAVSAVWVMDVNTTPSTVQASRDFVQFDLSGPVPAASTTWGRVKSLYR
jgi:hypothetical protein